MNFASEENSMDCHRKEKPIITTLLSFMMIYHAFDIEYIIRVSFIKWVNTYHVLGLGLGLGKQAMPL